MVFRSIILVISYCHRMLVMSGQVSDRVSKKWQDHDTR